MGRVIGSYEVSLDGHRLQVVPLNLACCGVVLAAGMQALAAAVDPVAVDPAAAAESMAGIAADTEIDLHVLVVAGTVTPAFTPRIEAAWAALPDPKVAIGFGVCTLSGGPYWDSYAVLPGVPPQLHPRCVPGCPPRPEALREALRVALVGVPA